MGPTLARSAHDITREPMALATGFQQHPVSFRLIRHLDIPPDPIAFR
jgi:hypothetical protein